MSNTSALQRLRAHQSELLELIFGCTADENNWQVFMRSLTELLDGRSSRLLVLNADADTVISSTKFNIDDSYHQQYVDYYVNACPWRPELKEKPKDRLYSTYLDFSCKQKSYYKTEFYNDWAAPQGIEHGICGTIIADHEYNVQLLVQRTAQPGHFTKEETNFVNGLVPAMRRSIELQAKLKQLESRVHALSRISSISSLPFILLDHSLKVLQMDQGAEQVIQRHFGLAIAGDRLKCKSTSLNERLQRLLKDCRDSSMGDWKSSGGTLLLQTEHRAHLELQIYPLPQRQELLFAPSTPYVAIFLHDLDQHYSLPHRAMRERFGLTPAENRLAESLVNGMSIQEYAEAHYKSVDTIRTQAKSLMRKTGTNRQASLARTLLPYLQGSHISK